MVLDRLALPLLLLPLLLLLMLGPSVLLRGLTQWL